MPNLALGVTLMVAQSSNTCYAKHDAKWVRHWSRFGSISTSNGLITRSAIPLHKVTIVQKYLPHYRASFFEQLRLRLAAEEIGLRLLVGEPSKVETSKGDRVLLSWAEPMDRWQWQIPNLRSPLEWHGLFQATANEDLVIVEDAVRVVSNAVLLMARYCRRSPRVALWGHGVDLQGGDGPVKGGIRRAQQRRADWYFGYTPAVVQRVVAIGVNPSRTTCVMNTIDTQVLQSHLDRVTEEETAQFIDSINADDSSRIALYVGGLYEEKRIEFLLDAGEKIAERLPGFRLVVAGAGPMSSMLVERSLPHDASWLHYKGPLFGSQLAVLLKSASILLMPGLVGLVVVDSFVSGCPIVTTADARHSPEIEYLEDGVNGLMLASGTTAQEYAERVCRLLDEPRELAKLQSGALLAAARFSMPQMVERFGVGVRGALVASP